MSLSFQNKEIQSREKISSIETNESNLHIANDIRELYRKASSVSGDVRYATDLMVATNTCMERALNDILYKNSDDISYFIPQTTKFRFPTHLNKLHRANIDKTYNVITGGILNVDNQILKNDINGYKSIRRDLVLERMSDNITYDANVDEVMESSGGPSDIFISDKPYIVKFKGPMTKANLRVKTSYNLREMTFNTIKVNPIPNFYNTVLSNIKMFNKNMPLSYKDYNGNNLSLQLIDETDRTYPMYISLERTQCNSLEFIFDSNIYHNIINSMIIGIGSIEVLDVSYGYETYFGIMVNTNSCNYIDIEYISTNISSDISGVSHRVYDSLSEFNNMSNIYISDSSYNILTPNDVYYILFKITRNDDLNTSPILRGIKITKGIS